MDHYECPDCRSVHAEPAMAGLGFRSRCLDCETEFAYRLEAYDSVVLQRAA